MKNEYLEIPAGRLKIFDKMVENKWLKAKLEIDMKLLWKYFNFCYIFNYPEERAEELHIENHL